MLDNTGNGEMFIGDEAVMERLREHQAILLSYIVTHKAHFNAYN